MIKTKRELKEYLTLESSFYDSIDTSLRGKIVSYLVKASHIELKKYLRYLRKSEYHYNNSYYKTNNVIYIYHDVLHVLYRRKKNILGRKLGIEIEEGVFGKGLLIYHPGNIVVNPDAKIGQNCKLHGSNCIGNKGYENKAPVIGNNVELGVGSSIIGNIELKNNIFVGANSIVTRSFSSDCVLVGTPAHILKKRG